jgi:hypothetical protein
MEEREDEHQLYSVKLNEQGRRRAVGGGQGKV